MVTDARTSNRNYPMPAAGNTLSEDLLRLIAAFIAIDADMATALLAAVNKAPLSSPNFTDVPTAPTAVPGTDTNQLATTAFVRAAFAALVDASPAALNTLNELAAALGDDPNFAATVNASIANRLSLTGGTMAGDINMAAYKILNGLLRSDSKIADLADATKRLQFIVSAITAGQTRTLTMPDRNIDLGMLGMERIAAIVLPSDSPSIDLLNIFSSTYEEYLLDLSWLLPASAATDVGVRLSTNGGSSWGAAYDYSFGITIGADYTGTQQYGQPRIRFIGSMGTSAGCEYSGSLSVHRKANLTIVGYQGGYIDDLGAIRYLAGSGRGYATYDSLQIIPSAGNLKAGTSVRIWGKRK